MRAIYLDTSALVKVYAWEPGSKRVRGIVRSAIRDPSGTVVMTADLTQTEGIAALARKERTGEITLSETGRYIEALERDFTPPDVPYYLIPNSDVIPDAGPLARQHGLKGVDAIHLAAALAAFHNAPLETTFRFACADGRLCDAAARENIDVIDLTQRVAAGTND